MELKVSLSLSLSPLISLLSLSLHFYLSSFFISSSLSLFISLHPFSLLCSPPLCCCCAFVLCVGVGLLVLLFGWLVLLCRCGRLWNDRLFHLESWNTSQSLVAECTDKTGHYNVSGKEARNRQNCGTTGQRGMVLVRVIREHPPRPQLT